jgi:hypothetical protein
MPAYNVYLASLGESGLTQEMKNAVQATLLGWFGEVVSGTSFTGAQVSWVDSVPAAIQNSELLVYFVSSVIDSVVVAMPGHRGGLGDDGTTEWANNLTSSEVYVSRSRNYLPQMAFHECMHNKLHLGDQALHALDGLARVPVAAGQRPSSGNITRMKNAISRNQPQWTGGWAALNDPLRGI